MPPRYRTLFLALAGTAFLATFFVSVLRREDATLGTPIVETDPSPSPRWSEVQYPSGTVLRGDLANQTLTPANSPYILEGTVRIPPGTTLRADPQTLIAASDGVRIVVEGTLEADRAAFVNNHLHRDRRLWHGLTAQRGGKIIFRDSAVADASAGITCAEGGVVSVTGGSISDTAAGIVTMSGCTTAHIDGLRIVQSRVGFHLLGGTPTITNVTLTRVFDGLRIFHEARPTLQNVTAKTLQHALAVHKASADLLIHGLSLPRGADIAALLIDGADTPTHRWQDQEFPTGRVIVQ
ncbi:MAG: hypothetical protein Q8R32_01190 [bacterium]|nr:hypothetical protein [bacterium]